jgi:hypothetical protein
MAQRAKWCNFQKHLTSRSDSNDPSLFKNPDSGRGVEPPLEILRSYFSQPDRNLSVQSTFFDSSTKRIKTSKPPANTAEEDHTCFSRKSRHSRLKAMNDLKEAEREQRREEQLQQQAETAARAKEKAKALMQEQMREADKEAAIAEKAKKKAAKKEKKANEQKANELKAKELKATPEVLVSDVAQHRSTNRNCLN